MRGKKTSLEPWACGLQTLTDAGILVRPKRSTPEEQPKILLARLPLCDREKGRMMMNIMEERKRRENLDDETVNLLSIPSLF
jgi:hypothetical protein